jgi:hypothetical protein
MTRIEVVGTGGVPTREESEAQHEGGSRIALILVRSGLSKGEISMLTLWNRASIGWCRTFHPETLWPVHGHYRCRACLRTYPVPWQEGNALAPKP